MTHLAGMTFVIGVLVRLVTLLVVTAVFGPDEVSPARRAMRVIELIVTGPAQDAHEEEDQN